MLWTVCFLVPVLATVDLSAERTPGGIALPPSYIEPLPATFLPLCGNGRIDTIADYKQLDASAATFLVYNPSSPTDPPSQATLYANETCDDGNRLDHDGCSADCMHRDLWVSSCELQLDTPTSTFFEGLVLQDGKGVLSMEDGLYSLQLTPAPGDTSLSTALLVSKTFPVTTLLSEPRGSVVYAYSAPQQKVWKYETGALTPWMDLSGVLSGASYAAYRSGDWALMHDDNNITIVNTFKQRVIGRCMVSHQRLDAIVYMGNQDGTSMLLGCVQNNMRIQVTVLQNESDILCSVLPKNFKQADGTRNIWNVALDAMTGSTNIEPIYYAVEVVSASLLPKPSFMRIYWGLGSWLDVLVYSARNWISHTASAQIPSLVTWTGNPLMTRAASDSTGKICNSDMRCAFDVSPDYDLFRPTRATTGTWQAVLQSVIDTRFPGASSAQALFNTSDPLTSSQFQSEWTLAVAAYVKADHMLRGTIEVPSSGNLWVLRDDGLFEVVQSGVQVQVSAGGKCMPSGLALCPSCMWAPAGGVCKACGTISNDWAWYASCQGCQGSRRRRLLGEAGAAVAIEFSVRGRAAINASCVNQPSTTWTDLGEGLWDVKVWANDPAACMRDLVPALAQLEVVTRPFTAVVLPPSQPSVAADGRLPAASIAGYAVAGAFVLAALLGIGVYCFRAPSSQHITYKRLEGGSTSADADAVPIRRRMLL